MRDSDAAHPKSIPPPLMHASKTLHCSHGPPQARADKLSKAAAGEQGFTYEAQWQVASAAPPTSAAGQAPASQALRLQLTAADGAHTFLGLTAGTTAAETLAELGPQQPRALCLVAPCGTLARHTSQGLPRDRAAGRWAAATTAPRLAAHALQALQHFTADAGGVGSGSAAALESVSLSSSGEGSGSALPHG